MQTQAPKCPGFCLVNVLRAFCESPSVIVSHTSNCKEGSVCCDNTRLATTQKPKPRPRPTPPPTRPPPAFLPTTTLAPDYREECPGSCIVSLLSFTCFRNAEMSDLFKCKKSGTTCCAPKSRIHEVQGMMIRNDSFPGFVNPQNQQQIPQYMANNNNYPNGYSVPPNGFPASANNYQSPLNNYPAQQPSNHFPHQPQAPANNYVIPPPNYPNPNHYAQNGPINANLQPAFSTPVYEIPTQSTTTTTTTTVRTPVYSKYVCGVKGTSRTSKKIFLDRIKPLHKLEHRIRRQVKSSERLILGSELIPIQIHNDKLGEFAQQRNVAVDTLPETKSIIYDSAPQKQLVYNQNYTSYSRHGRVVGGEDGENGEWCWQVALINSMNQYLCGAALIGTQWVLTAAHCVTK